MSLSLATLATIAAVTGGVTAAGGAIGGAIGSAKANKKSQNIINTQRNKNAKWYSKQMNSDYLSRSDSQAILKKQKELLDEYSKRASATSVVSGGTDEASAMAKASANKSIENTMTNLAGQASAYKDQVEARYQQTDNSYAAQQAQIEQNKANQIAQAGGQAVNAGLGLLGNGLTMKANN